MSDYLERTKNGTSFVGSDVNIFAAAVLSSALMSYSKTGMVPNKNYTPLKMLLAASVYTKKKYKRGQYEEAAADLTAYVNALKAQPLKLV